MKIKIILVTILVFGIHKVGFAEESKSLQVRFSGRDIATIECANQSLIIRTTAFKAYTSTGIETLSTYLQNPSYCAAVARGLRNVPARDTVIQITQGTYTKTETDGFKILPDGQTGWMRSGSKYSTEILTITIEGIEFQGINISGLSMGKWERFWPGTSCPPEDPWCQF